MNSTLDDPEAGSRRLHEDLSPGIRSDYSRKELSHPRGSPAATNFERRRSRTAEIPGGRFATAGIHERRHAHPLGHRAGRPAGGRASSCPWSTTNCASWPPSGWRHEKPGQTLQATALVHEAYLRLVGQRTPSAGTAAATSSPPRPRPCAASSSRTPAARPAPRPAAADERVSFDEVELAIEGPRVDLLALDEALTAWRPRTSRKADLVRLRFFAGLTIEQAAEALGISAATADNDWAYAKSLAPPGHARRRAGRARADRSEKSRGAVGRIGPDSRIGM